MIKNIMSVNETVAINEKQMQVLREHFPACFHGGEFDLERFKEYLGDSITVNNEGYELRFLGKNYARLLASVDTTTVVVPDEEHNAKPENANSQNVYISGDNLDGLKHLLKSYSKGIKCIYIDPPYNTGSDGFVYNDTFNFTVDELTSKLSISEEQATRILNLTKKGSASHSAWLMFMYPRLLLARDLLADDGVIFISIDDNEQATLKMLCDDVFDESNYINTISVKTKASSGASGGGEDQRLKKNYETVFWYARNKDYFSFESPIEKTLLTDYIAQHKQDNIGFYYTRILKDLGNSKKLTVLNPGTDDEIHISIHEGYTFSSINEVCRDESITEEEAYRKYFDKIFMVTNAQTSLLTKVNDVVGCKGKLVSYKYVPKTGRSKGKEETKFIWNETLVVWLKDSAYIDCNRVVKTEKIGTLWDNISWGRLDIEGNMPYKNGKKPTSLIRQLMNMVVAENDIVLDFFSGSASTAHACFIESTNGKKLHSISIQLPENLDENIKHASSEKKKELKKLIDILDEAGRKHFLDEIGQERMVRAAKQIKEEYPDTTADLGFRHYTLIEPSIDTLDKLEKFDVNENGMFASDMLNEFGIPTVLSTWLVRDGYGLTATPEKLVFADYEAYYIGKHLYLITQDLSKEAIDAILVKYETDGTFNPENIVLFGYSFTWTEMETLKTNLKRLKDIKNLHVNFDVRY